MSCERMKYTQSEIQMMADEGDSLKNQGHIGEALTKLIPAAEYGNVDAMLSLADIYKDVLRIELKWLIAAYKLLPDGMIDETIDYLLFENGEIDDELIEYCASLGYPHAISICNHPDFPQE